MCIFMHAANKQFQSMNGADSGNSSAILSPHPSNAAGPYMLLDILQTRRIAIDSRRTPCKIWGFP